MNASRRFLRAAGGCGLAAGAVTLAIVILPRIYGPSTSLDQQIALHGNELYQLRQWLSFGNVFLILTAGWGLAIHRLPRSPGPAFCGALFLTVYAAAELLGRSAMIFAREYRWIHELVDATGTRRAELLLMVEGFDTVWAAWFVLILLSFVVAWALLGWSCRGGRGLQRATSWLLLTAAALGLVTLLASYVGALRPVATWGYVLIQPASRVALGVYLWSEGRSPDA